jgi:hypothetical protein
MTHLSVTQFETRQRLIEAELERDHPRVAGRRVLELPRWRRSPRRWLRAVRGAAA